MLIGDGSQRNNNFKKFNKKDQKGKFAKKSNKKDFQKKHFKKGKRNFVNKFKKKYIKRKRTPEEHKLLESSEEKA